MLFRGGVIYNTPLIATAIIIGMLGQGIRIWVAGFAPKDTSGRNTKEQKASVFGFIMKGLFLLKNIF